VGSNPTPGTTGPTSVYPGQNTFAWSDVSVMAPRWQHRCKKPSSTGPAGIPNVELLDKTGSSWMSVGDYGLDLSVVDVAGTLECAEGTVKAHLSHARETLATRLDQTAEEL
jgi:hypothetical protein